MTAHKQIFEIEKYIAENVREIDRVQYDFHFVNGEAPTALCSLEKYQNDDGGFGNTTELDFCLPQLTSFGGWLAFKLSTEGAPDPDQLVGPMPIELPR